MSPAPEQFGPKKTTLAAPVTLVFDLDLPAVSVVPR